MLLILILFIKESWKTCITVSTKYFLFFKLIILRKNNFKHQVNKYLIILMYFLIIKCSLSEHFENMKKISNVNGSMGDMEQYGVSK